MTREPALFVPVFDFKLFLVGLGEPGKIQIATVLSFGVEVHHSENVHQGFLLSYLLHGPHRF